MKPFLSLNTKTIYLVRHGLATLDGYGDRILTAGLLPQGRGPVERIAEYLKSVPLSYNITSGIPRCRETADIITALTDKKFVIENRLTEYHDEAFPKLQKRIVSLLNDLSLIPQNFIIICSHAAVITGIKEYVLTGVFEFQAEYDFPLEGTLAILANGVYREVDFNGKHDR